MSLVGPRPEQDWVVAIYDDLQRLRLLVKPGLTGPMQVAGRSDLDLNVCLELEMDYINHYSLLNDIAILIKAPLAIFSARGAY